MSRKPNANRSACLAAPRSGRPAVPANQGKDNTEIVAQAAEPVAEAQGLQLFASFPEVMRPEEVAAALRVNRSVVYAMCREGQIPNVKIGSRIYVPRDALAARLLGR